MEDAFLRMHSGLLTMEEGVQALVQARRIVFANCHRRPSSPRMFATTALHFVHHTACPLPFVQDTYCYAGPTQIHAVMPCAGNHVDGRGYGIRQSPLWCFLGVVCLPFAFEEAGRSCGFMCRKLGAEPQGHHEVWDLHLANIP